MSKETCTGVKNIWKNSSTYSAHFFPCISNRYSTQDKLLTALRGERKVFWKIAHSTQWKLSSIRRDVTHTRMWEERMKGKSGALLFWFAVQSEKVRRLRWNIYSYSYLKFPHSPNICPFPSAQAVSCQIVVTHRPFIPTNGGTYDARTKEKTRVEREGRWRLRSEDIDTEEALGGRKREDGPPWNDIDDSWG